ncbi:hypothetical protein FVE85_5850 [Porphyridium purpureum]|uniref:Uncharacterized protein n=1 Tax=Porphyridium purpureum TaxID=35688 RepID=A0A5J4Z4L0_PORPP|nr:hypothetical protein FVE85_5850 [Porphyridium purpureum]|eukprot:POR3625..scf295_1
MEDSEGRGADAESRLSSQKVPSSGATAVEALALGARNVGVGVGEDDCEMERVWMDAATAVNGARRRGSGRGLRDTRVKSELVLPVKGSASGPREGVARRDEHDGARENVHGEERHKKGAAAFPVHPCDVESQQGVQQDGGGGGGEDKSLARSTRVTFDGTASPLPRMHSALVSFCESRGISARQLRIILRALARTFTYCLYDLLSVKGFRDGGRIVKIAAEAGIDEVIPPMSFSFWRHFFEYLLPCGISSLVLLYLVPRRRGAMDSGKYSHSSIASRLRNAGLMLFRFAYRIVRQAVIYRLFFAVGSYKYYLVTLAAIVCAFFREECLWDLFNVHKWPSHFCFAQGWRAILQTVAYASAFALPLASWSPIFQTSYRRGNMKKLIFFSSWIVFVRLYSWLLKRMRSARRRYPGLLV